MAETKQYRLSLDVWIETTSEADAEAELETLLKENGIEDAVLALTIWEVGEDSTDCGHDDDPAPAPPAPEGGEEWRNSARPRMRR